MKIGSHYLVEAYSNNGREPQALAGLQTDDLEQALQRGRRLWETGFYAGVSVVESHWHAEVGRYLPTGTRIRVWGEVDGEAAAA